MVSSMSVEIRKLRSDEQCGPAQGTEPTSLPVSFYQVGILIPAAWGMSENSIRLVVPGQELREWELSGSVYE